MATRPHDATRHAWRSPALLLLSALMAGGCSTAAPIPSKTEDFEAVIEVDDIRRTYQVHVPAGYSGDTEYPLLLALHGAGFGGAGMRSTSGFDSTADRHGFVVAYPDGIDGGWLWDESFSDSVDDVKFLVQLLKRLDAQLSLDLDRVYVTGFSAGGMMTQKLACSEPGRFAGIAVVGATLPRGIRQTCLSAFGMTQPFSVLSILGTGDPLIPFDGDTATTDFALLSAAETMETWAARASCDLTPDTTVAYEDATFGITTRRLRYSNCRDGLEVELYAMEGAGHLWPTVIFPASEVIATFLLGHQR